jgi:hypothetical protein
MRQDVKDRHCSLAIPANAAPSSWTKRFVSAANSKKVSCSNDDSAAALMLHYDETNAAKLALSALTAAL